MPQAAPGKDKPKKKHTQRTGHKQKKKEEGNDDDPMFCSFSPCPDDAFLARGATYQKKKKDSLYDFEKRIIGLTDELRGKYSK